jgi:ABC-type glycerol-3-phosphate transport system permease component
VIANSLIAYAFARIRFRGRNLLFGLVIATMLLPAPVLLIPQFLLFFNIGWYDSYLPLTVPALAGNAFFIFLLRQYMRTIPRELDEAARIDGAGHWTIYSRIVLPLTAPALTVVALFTFLGVWNDFFGPLLYLQDQDKFTVAVALALERSRIGVEWNELMAANLIAIVPPLVLYFVAQKRLIGGIASVGLKG